MSSETEEKNGKGSEKRANSTNVSLESGWGNITGEGLKEIKGVSHKWEE